MGGLITITENPQNVQFYSHHARELMQTQKHKILKFLEFKCIEYLGDNVYICKPIPGYNKTTYKIEKMADHSFRCECQGFKKRIEQTGEGNCSHIGALYEYFSRGQKYG